MGEYLDLVKEFRSLTSMVNSESGRCCRKVWRGVPSCCEQIAHNKGSLEFTENELNRIVEELGPLIRTVSQFEFEFVDEGFRLLRTGRIWRTVPFDSSKMIDSLHDGLLADTLECGSHPTRPLFDVRTDRVVGVVTVGDCVAEEHLHVLFDKADRLFELWRVAVDLCGVKPYYQRTDGFSGSGKVMLMVDDDWLKL